MGAALGHAIVAARQIPRRRELQEQPSMSALPATTPLGDDASQPQTPALPRLLAGIPAEGAMALQEHLAEHGAPPPAHARGRRSDRDRAERLIDEIDAAGLLGRGGAAFPTATKMRAVARSRGRAVVLANAAEGEPASLKDRTLLEALPHLVLDGGLLAAQAVGADELVICVCESFGAGSHSLAEALQERAETADYAEFDRLARVRLTTVPGHYVAGQETALINHAGGGPAKPLFTPPMPFEQGLRRRPTLVNNAETLAHIALIARHGAAWFRQLGTPTQPGSALVTLSGPVAHPGVYEIEHGASLSSLIEAGGGTTAGLRGALIGGYSGAWIGAERLRGIALSNEYLAPHGATLGAGVVLLLSDETCPVAETARLARWLSGQSTRQCGPCVHGLDALAGAVEQIAGGDGGGKAAQRVERLASLVVGRGACRHPDGTVNVLLSAVEAFPAEFADHARRGPCDRCAGAQELPLPRRPLPPDPARRARVRLGTQR
jgi:NADH:ubiquinone oxidoreductase subunit F (NADH-binding)